MVVLAKTGGSGLVIIWWQTSWWVQTNVHQLKRPMIMLGLEMERYSPGPIAGHGGTVSGMFTGI